MFGVPLEGPTNMFVDKSSVVLNATVPSSTLKKKHNSIAYHRIREAIAALIIRIGKVNGKKNLSDMFTKPLPAGELTNVIQKVLYFPNYFDHEDELPRLKAFLLKLN
jgi:hypothetical protein